MNIKLLSTLLALTISFLSYAQSVPKQIKLLDNYIQDAIKVWNPPGLVVTVVKDGEIVFAKGYGTRTLGENKPVDEHTLFLCASTTKAFTAAALAILVDEGKVNWDDHVIDYLPDFQLYDPYMTREITVRDLLTHRTGLGNTDYLWAWMTISGDSALYKMREVKPNYSIRSSFIYQNLMYLAAGKVIEKASGQSWASFLQKRIYDPLGMKETYPHYKDVKDKPNIADAHYKYEGEIRRIDQSTADEIGPAGSMWASIGDMGKWIRFLLNDGIYQGDTLISAVNFKELFKPQQIIPQNQFYPTAELTKPHWMTYGLGWFQHDYRGKMVQFHTGSLAGMVAIAGLIPDENIGVYVMSNLDHVELRHAIMYTVFDLFLDNKITTDWSSDLKDLYDKLAADRKDEDPERISDTMPSSQIIVGKYMHQQYGMVEITKNGDQLLFKLNDKIEGKLEHWHYDTYQISFNKEWYGTSMITFHMDAEANVSYLESFGQQFYITPPKE
jgi:CubicO group peptidase (beta-lactamase class C family)